MATEIIKVPDIGTSDKVTIIEVSVKAGDTIAEDDTLIVLESDKASMDVPAPMAGKVSTIKVSEGDEIGEGDEILYLEVEGSTSEDVPAAESAKDSKKPAPKKSSGGSSAVKPLKVPDIGSDDPVDIIEVHVKPGDMLKADDPIVTLESDKASMEVPATEAGEVVSVKVQEGDQVKEGDLLIEIKAAGGADNSEAVESAPTAESTSDSDTGTDEGSVESIKVPDIGTDGSVDIIEVHVKPGDTLNEDDPIVTLESDKASMEVPSPKSGEVVSVKVEVGTEVKEGDLLIELKVAGAASSPAPQPKSEPPTPASKAPAPKASDTGYQTPTIVSGDDDEIVRPSKPVHAGPAVRKLAREFGVDLALVAGSGPRERIVKDDVAAFVKKKIRQPERVTGGAGIPAVPDQDFSKFGTIEEKEMSRIQQLTAANMARNWLNIPHVTQFDEADVTDLEAFRQSLKPEMEKRGVKISPLAFLVKACAAALHEFPQFNVSLKADGTHLVQKHYVHIGLAVDTPNGLIVPVIRDADKKSIWQIAEEIIDFAQRGRQGKVKSNEMQGGCFTISSLGGLGGTAFTPIVNAPEVAILGVSKNQVKPHWNGQSFEPRTFTPLSLSYDHRAVNGADAARFTTYLCEALQDLRRILL
ncbi:MAG: dihydrolipoyllysine-residue acetyltransferase [Natronospirillum sp.]|uniref:dihydrolipoyllysine-residue acetyltransferase n=1 Tax=Natronospirillum sp. TaxID=2812955 RepID=UPI0025D6D242|nr:dihydrolipoyllysine-residue acetyltransferase [Natronospirillum sp.]MCH8552050.1 dihydrolipoyllysine-residue acetyltransferase [Natronospirillum sp.]